VNLYLRLFWLLLRIAFLPRRALFDESRVAFRVLPNDCDINFHMNNGRYLSFMDLGRVHLMKQSGLLGVIIRKRWMPVLAAAEITFIRSLAPLQRFELVTRLVSWDDKYVYIEQKFEAGGASRILCAHAFVKALTLKRGVRVSNSEVAAAAGYTAEPPPLPDELRLWADLGSAKKQRAVL
jgi:acyl-CoA thioesterase FadM